MMKNFDQSFEISSNPDWSYMFNHPYRIVIIGGLRSRKTNLLLKLAKRQRTDIDKNLLYVQDLFEWKYRLTVNGRVKVRITELKNLKAFGDYSQTIDDVHENSETITQLWQ